MAVFLEWNVYSDRKDWTRFHRRGSCELCRKTEKRAEKNGEKKRRKKLKMLSRLSSKLISLSLATDFVCCCPAHPGHVSLGSQLIKSMSCPWCTVAWSVHGPQARLILQAAGFVCTEIRHVLSVLLSFAWK